MEQSNIKSYFERCMVGLGLPRIRIHDLRHTCVTMLPSKGVHLRVVQGLHGRGRISIPLDTYSYVLPTSQEEAARALESILAT